MLILLEPALVKDLEHASAIQISYLDELLFYHSKFYHYVGASKRTAIELSESLEGRLSSRGLQTLRTISTQSNDLSNFLSTVRYHAVIKSTGLAGCFLHVEGEKMVWNCDLQFAAKWFSQPTTVIGENLTDTKIFRASGRDFAANLSIDFQMQKFSSEMCGGSGNAPAVMKNRIAEGASPVLCIIDSDKLSLDSDFSDSVKKCRIVLEKMGGVAHFVPLDERELENLLPNPILKGAILCLPVSPDRDSILQRADLIENLRLTNPDVYSYIDIKDGTCRTWAAKHNVADFFSAAPVVAPCSCHVECDGYIAPPIFKEVLGNASEFSERQSIKQLRDSLKNERLQSWVKLGETVMSFSLSNSVRNT